MENEQKRGKMESIFPYNLTLNQSQSFDILNTLGMIYLEPNNRPSRFRTPSKKFKLKIKSEAIV